MPIYEFVCTSCKRRFRKLVGVVAQPSPLACPRCHSTVLNRQISRFSRVRNEDDALDSLADQMEGIDENDPKALRRAMREMGKEMGEDMDDDFEQMMEEEAAGAGAEGDGGEGGDGMDDL